MPRATVVAVPFHAGLPGAASGRQRKHGRKPARSAAAAVAKNWTFLDFAGRTRQIGRQEMRVVRTHVKNIPSNARSRVTRARSQISQSRPKGSTIFIPAIIRDGRDDE